MDKYEYKVRSEEIKDLIGKKKYAEAMKIADTIDWRRVKNVNMLCTVSDLYKMNRRYEESREILLLAYERHPGGRMIVYSLCELSIKLDDVVQAVEYYKEFVQTAPRDNGRYVLQYKLYEAQEVTLEERIAVLEELKRREYREKWAYELAYLYHRIGLSTKCVEECDELILWFGEGKYVTKAMELKMLHAPLTQEQQEKYKKSKGSGAMAAPLSRPEEDEEDMLVKPVNVGEYATINLQKELAESMKEVLGEEAEAYEPAADWGSYEEERLADKEIEEEPGYEEEASVEQEPAEDPAYQTKVILENKAEPVPAEYAAAQPLYKTEEPCLDQPGDFTTEILSSLLQDTGEIKEIRMSDTQELPEAEEIYFEDTDTQELSMEAENVKTEAVSVKEEAAPMEQAALLKTQEDQKQTAARSAVIREDEESRVIRMSGTGEIPRIVQSTKAASFMPSAESLATVKNENFDSLLSQEYDGQISLAVPEKDSVEKQITGQMSIEDILLEWEKMKKENEEKRAEAVRKRVQEQTGEIFSQFDASTKQGLLAELDAMAEESIEKEKSGLTKEEEKKLAAVAALEEDFPEVEELEEIQEATPTESFSEEALQAVQQAAKEAGQTDGAAESVQPLTEESKQAGLAQPLVKEGEQTAAAVQTSGKEEEQAEKASVKEAEQPEKASAKEAEQAAERSSAKEPEQTAEKERQRIPQRQMTPEEKKLFGPFIQTKTTKNQILDTLDHISLASYTGNVILTGEPGMDSIKLAKNIIKDIQMTDSNFSGRMAKITGQALNHKDLEKTFEKLSNGALIVEGAGALKETTLKAMRKLLEQEKQGIIVILEDTKITMNKLLDNSRELLQNFNLRIDVEALDNDSLVLFAKKYAFEKEYSIDELGVLALYTRIAELQTSEHSVTTREVKEIVDEAIDHADRKTISHFMDVLVGKRYDGEDMIILREKDFA